MPKTPGETRGPPVWIVLSRVWPSWKKSLLLVRPETVIGWHRRGFRLSGPGFHGVSDRVGQEQEVNSGIWSVGWRKPILCGAHPAFTESC